MDNVINNIQIFVKKIYSSYTKLPMKIRFVLILLFFMMLFVASVSLKNSIKDQEDINNKPGIVENNREKVRDSSNIGNKNTIPVPKEVKIVIDPGHGGEDWGAIKGDLFEKDLNLDISLKLGKILEEKNINVIYTRQKDIDVSLDERVNIANNNDATLFISVHNNYMPNDAAYRGTETLYCVPVNPEENKMDGQKLAAIVQKKLVSTLKTVDNGTIHRPNLVVLRKTNMPAVIAEIAYMSNSSDREKLLDEGFRQKAAEALAEAVMEALDLMNAKKNEKGEWIIMD
ncbi:N-acetylmuramoyl-L-alanine amidase family protein [Acetivibrio clariflavus]|uniref:N-acetylmuramoyl-L-alanine amidase n=1 Tax=Acetivibrio clariflavus (strain DSM 19732 / NBRC 101661 / EBR45) TaxID=720554 RepID=G8M0M3_ACECE|nr:N-acetylmuramoyl-L-alanine amidase [Acetivibrio clariflavus]AEV69104.1 N-acetylmuramoyl-L-alanine amidase [Acetivibrio clariflavus DSM 19732]